MQKLFFILIGIIFLNAAQAQKYCKPGGFAFSILIVPGTIPVDENRVEIKRRINKQRFIYIITSGKSMPAITTITYDKTPVKWNLPGTAEKEFEAVTENTQKKMSIKPSKGCSMWKIDIQEMLNHPISEKIQAITIKGSTNNKSFSLLLNKEIAVQGLDNY